MAPPAPRARSFRFSREQRTAVVAEYEAGATMAALVKQYGVKRQTISELLKREGASIRVRRSMSQAEVDDSVRRYTAGESLQRIGDQLGWDHNTIYRQLKKRGVTMRGPSDWKY